MATLYGKGHIREIEKGKKYHIELSTGLDPETGEYGRARETFLGTRRQAELRIEQIRAKAELRRELYKLGVTDSDLMRHGLDLEAAMLDGMSARQVRDRLDGLDAEVQAARLQGVLFADVCERYLSGREQLGKRRKNTYRIDRCLSKHLLKQLGNTPVVSIDPEAARAAVYGMQADGVGANTICKAFKLLQRIMRYAVKENVCDLATNPIEYVEAPEMPAPKRYRLDAADAMRLGSVLTEGTPTANRTAAYFALHTGARLGETLGLEWQHVYTDGPRPYAYLVQQLLADGTTGPLKTDKNGDSFGRVAPLDASTVAALNAWRKEQQAQLEALGIKQDGATPVFTSGAGSWLNHSNYERWWRGFCVDNGFGRWVDDDGRPIIALTVGTDAGQYGGCRIEWRDVDGWPCDEDGKRYSRTYKRPARKRKYDGLRFHSLRHSFFTEFIHSGHGKTDALYLGGWNSTQMLDTCYVHPTPETVWNSVGFMDNLDAGKCDTVPGVIKRFANDLPKTESATQSHM